MERPKWPKKHIWEYQTTNSSILHAARPLLDFLTGWKSDGKISYWFDWQVVNVPKNFQGVTLCGDPTAPFVNSKLDEFRIHFGMWERAYLIGPENEDEKSWQYGFLIPNRRSRRMSLCSLILEGPVKALVGSTPLTVFGMNLKHQEIPLQTWGMCRRRGHKRSTPLI